MRKFYIDVKFGDDIQGDGSASKPFMTLTRAVPLINHGDEVIVNDSYYPDTAEDYIYEEPDTVELISLSNITLRFLYGIDQDYCRSVWKPTTVGHRKASLYIEGCTDIRVEGATFLSTSDLVDHAHAVKVVNSTNVTVSGCTIHGDWEVDNSDSGELFSFYGSTATISSNKFFRLNNSYSNSLAFIAVDGNGAYNIYANSIQNLTSNNGIFRGIWVKPETREVIIDGFLGHNLESDLVDMAIGIHLESDNSKLKFTVNGAQLSNVHVGVRLSNIPIGADDSMVKHCTFYKCRKAIDIEDSVTKLYSISIHGNGNTIQHEYPPGHVVSLPTYGVFADDYSYADILNTAVTGCGEVVHSQGHSKIDMAHIIWHNCGTLKGGDLLSINAIQYIRRVDPKYEDLHSSPWGYFLMSNTSPCIDAGKKYGDLFIGVAPDIGALERSRALRIDDLPALIARASRYSSKIPLTNIDVEGMIVRGLDTYDPEIKAGREGSAVRDMAVKPLVGLLTPYVTELEDIRNNLSFADLETLSEEAADALASNVFVTRKTGDVSTGIVRIFFESPSEVIIPAEMEFISSEGLRFYSIQSVSMSAEEMALNFSDGLFYADIIAEGELPGAEYNIPSGSITRSTSPLPEGTTAVLNPYDFSGGSNAETNAELKARIETAITVRDLVTKKGITYVMPEQFTFIKDIRPIGFRDPEMLRDEILGYHIGGKVDIYIQTNFPIVDSKVVELAPAEIPIDLASFGNVPLLRVKSIEVLDPLTLDTIGVEVPSNKYTLEVTDPKTRFSIYEQLVLKLHRSVVGQTIQINYEWIPEMKSLQTWVTESENRVVCADLIVKHFEPAFTSFDVAYYAPEEVSDLGTLLRVFITMINSGSALQESDIIEYCHSVGAVHVVNPFPMEVVVHTVSGDQIKYESEDEIVIPRTSSYIPDNITVTYLGADPTED